MNRWVLFGLLAAAVFGALLVHIDDASKKEAIEALETAAKLFGSF